MNWVIIGTGNGLASVWRQAITWTSDNSLSIWTLATNFDEILWKIQIFLWQKWIVNVVCEMTAFRSGLNVWSCKTYSKLWCPHKVWNQLFHREFSTMSLSLSVPLLFIMAFGKWTIWLWVDSYCLNWFQSPPYCFWLSVEMKLVQNHKERSLLRSIGTLFVKMHLSSHLWWVPMITKGPVNN